MSFMDAPATERKKKNDQKPRPSNFLLSKAPTDVRAYDGKFFIMSTEFDKNISD